MHAQGGQKDNSPRSESWCEGPMHFVPRGSVKQAAQQGAAVATHRTSPLRKHACFVVGG
jgi:hypothetical protein